MPNARRAALTVAVGVVFAILVFGHVPYVNGPDYWQWAWQRRGDLLLVVGCLALASSPAFLAQRVRSGTLAVALLGLSVIALQFTANAIQLGLHGVRRIEVIAHDQLQTSYFTVAASIVAAERAGAPVDWLGDYDEILRHAPQHATTKPPGPLAFYVAMVRVAGPENAPMAIAVVIGLLSAAAVVATWVGVRIVAGEEAALQAATLLALAPSMTLFFLYLDPLYPILTCGLLAMWFLTLERESRCAAILFGLLLFITTTISYTLLVLGITLGGMTLARLWRGGSLHRIAELALTAIGVAVGAHVIFAFVTGFNPISAFRTAIAMQAYQLPLLHRPWPKTIPFDLLDYFLGAGVVAPVPAAFWVATRRREETPGTRAAALWALATPLVVALMGLIQAETARVWIFLLPLLFLPAALELRRWTPRQRSAVHATMLLVLIALYANMVFIKTGSR